MRQQTQMLRILETLDREGALTNKKIHDLTNMPEGTIRCYTSMLNQTGLIRHFKDMRGVYEITQEGRDYVRKRQRKGEEE